MLCTFGLGSVSVHLCRNSDGFLTIITLGIGHYILTHFYFLVYVGDGINNYYFPFILTIGIIGNILSFMVSKVSQSSCLSCISLLIN